MTLKEKLRQNLTGHLLDEKTEVDVNIATVIAEEFAIGFAEWFLNLSKSDDWEKFDYNTNEKLLEIYKKEKGL